MQRTVLYLSYLLMVASSFVALLLSGARLDFWQMPWAFGLGTQDPFVGTVILSGYGFGLLAFAVSAVLLSMAFLLLSVPCQANNREWRELANQCRRIRAIIT